MLKDLSNTAKVFQWTSLQSFVLDNKVNAVLREKGFDMSVIETDVQEALASFATAIVSGYRPPTAREAIFLASTLATAMLDYERGEQDALQGLEFAAMIFKRDLPDVYTLACQLAASIRRHGYSDRASIGRAIDECAQLSFAFLGESFDLDRELIEEKPTEAYQDKYPEYFTGLPVPAKLEIGKAMARMKIPAGSECRLSYTPGGSVQVQFCQTSGAWTSPVMLHHASRLPNDVFSRGQRPLQKGSVPMQQPVHSAPTRNVPQPSLPSVAAPSPFAAPLPNMPNMPMPGGSHMRRTYAPGIARFLSQVRLAEQLGGEHSYGYALNNPVTYIDPDGAAPQKGGSKNPNDGCTPKQRQQISKALDDLCKNRIKHMTNPKAISCAQNRNVTGHDAYIRLWFWPVPFGSPTDLHCLRLRCYNQITGKEVRYIWPPVGRTTSDAREKELTDKIPPGKSVKIPIDLRQLCVLPIGKYAVELQYDTRFVPSWVQPDRRAWHGITNKVTVRIQVLD